MMSCKCYHADKNFLGKIGVCWGTKECEPCSCNGDEAKCDFYDYVRERAKKPITKADQIRVMTDEELDRFLSDVQWDVANYCGDVIQKMEYPLPKQRGAWLDWLKKEVDDE